MAGRACRRAGIALLVLGLTWLSAPPGATAAKLVGRQDTTVAYLTGAASRYLVKVRIDDRLDMTFLIDTGASNSGIFKRAVEAFGIDVDTKNEVLVRGLIEARRSSFIPISSIGLGGTSQPVDRLVVLRDPVEPVEADGVLGMDFLHHYALVFNSDRNTVRFIPARDFSARRYRRWDRVPLNPGPEAAHRFGLYFSELQFGAQAIPVLIDIGSQQTIMNWLAFDALAIFEPLRDTLTGMPAFEGASGERVTSLGVTIARMKMGQHLWGPQRILILDLAPLAVLGAADGPFAIVASDFFAGRSFVIDFEGLEILIRPERRRR